MPRSRSRIISLFRVATLVQYPAVHPHRTRETSGALLATLLIATSLSAADWPHWRGPDRTGISRETGWEAKWPAEGPKELWRQSVGTGFSSVSVSNGRVYTMGNENDTDTVFSFDAATGRRIWTHSYPCPLNPRNYEGGPSVTPTVDGGRVFTLSRRGDVFCFDAASGDVIWSKNIAEELGAEIPTWGFAGSPLVEGGLLILNVGSAGTGLDKKTGRVVWKSGADAAGYATPVPLDWKGERHVLVFVAKHLVMANARTGKELWRHPWETSYDVNAADPIVAGDKIFISSGYKRGGALLQMTGAAPKVLWEKQVMGNQMNASVLFNGHLYGFNGNANPRASLKCVELETGNEKWAEKSGYGSVTIADGKLIVLSDRGELSVAEAAPGGFNSSSRAHVMGGKCWTVPVLSNGRLYLRNARGDLACFDLQTAGR